LQAGGTQKYPKRLVTPYPCDRTTKHRNSAKIPKGLGTAAALPFWYLFVLYSRWFLVRAYERKSSPLTHRHVMYILISFLVIAMAQMKIAVFLGLDNGYLRLPACCS
jgi:uncharacterized membrane protein